jgi:hypothetical protein
VNYNKWERGLSIDLPLKKLDYFRYCSENDGMSATSKGPISAFSYSELRSRIETILIQVQSEMEALKLKTYWQTGVLMDQYLEHRVSEEVQVAKQLAQDLGLNSSALYRMLQFARAYPKGPPPVEALTWSHVKELLALPNSSSRKRLVGQMDESGWSVRRLRLEIRKVRGPKLKKQTGKPGALLTEPVLRTSGVRRVKLIQTLARSPFLAVDLGFELFEPLEANTGFKAGDPVSWNEENKTWVKTGTDSDLYYYEAQVERVVDGDTLLVHIEASPRLNRRQYLRLRGINTEERQTAAGQNARAWLEGRLREHPLLLIRTHLTDQYDRYIADVWAGALYLNNALLKAGFAIRAYS